MEEDRRLIYNRRGELCNTIIDLFKNGKDGNKYLPVFEEDTKYCMDWGIIGLEYKKYFCWTQLSNNMFCIEYPDDIDWRTWSEIRPKIIKWVSWISKNLFDPEKIIFSTFTTDRVKMRIAVAMLDKIELPRNYADDIFCNFVECYWSRKHIYSKFYYKYILDIPF